MDEGIGVAGRAEPGAGRNGARVECRKGCERACREPQKLAAGARAVGDEDERQGADHDDEKRKVLEADRHGQRHQRRGDREAGRARRIETLQEEAERRDERHDLRRVMIDAARRELHEHHAGQERQPDRREARRRPFENARQPGDERKERPHQREGKGDPRRALRIFRGEKGAKEHIHRRQRNVDDPRPVHRQSRGRIDAAGDQVEPGLAGKKVAQLDGAHGVVGIEKGACRPDRLDARPGQSGGGGERKADHAAQRQTHAHRPRSRHRAARGDFAHDAVLPAAGAEKSSARRAVKLKRKTTPAVGILAKATGRQA